MTNATGAKKRNRKVIYSQMVSLDGYMEGPDGDLNWSRPGDELFKHFNEQEKEIDTHLYGRRTYENMKAYWSTADTNPNSTEDEITFSRIWKETPKFVFSTTLSEVGENSSLVTNNIGAEVARLKGLPGKNMALGGAGLAETFMKHGLIDEYQLYIHPVVLGGGRRFFPELAGKINLQLKESRTFDGAVAALRYIPAD